MLSLLHGTEKIISFTFQAIRQAGKRRRCTDAESDWR